MTGCGLGYYGGKLREDACWDDSLVYCLDAPSYIARGSMLGSEAAGISPRFYASATDPRMGVWW